MHMVWHNHPGTKFITVAAEMSQSPGNQLGDFRPLEKALAVAGIQIGVHARRIPAEQLLLFPPGQRMLPSERALKNCFAFLLELSEHVTGQCASQSKGDKVCSTFALE